jgi:hypothetical protein
MTRHQFAKAFVAGLLALSADAFALSIEPLPGTTPQQAPIGTAFPNPLAVVVHDDSGSPLAGAAVRWFVPQFLSGLVIEGQPPGCTFDVGQRICEVPTDARGISTFPPIHGTRSTQETVTATATVADRTVVTHFELTVGSGAASPAGALAVAVLSGAGQRIPLGTTLPQPFSVRVTRADGSPAAGVPVTFRVASNWSQPAGSFGGEGSSQATTGADGVATSAPFTVGWGLGTGVVTAQAWDAQAYVPAWTAFDFVVTNAQGGDTLAFQDMWWGGPDQSGWGVSITQHGDKLFALLFAYDAAGKPTWSVLSDGYWRDGVGALFAGAMNIPRGAPWFDYQASRFDPGRMGSMELRFQGDSKGGLRVVWPLGGSVTEHALERFDFSRDDVTPLHGVGDLWWGGPAESGWGVSIMEKPGGLFSMWFTYDETGSPTWFVMPDGAWTSPNTYEGRMYRATGSPWFGTAYDASKFRATDVGPYRLRFVHANHAKLEYSVDGRTGVLDLERFDFD